MIEMVNKQLIWKFTRKLGLGWLIISFYPKSILVEDGWFTSYQIDIPMNKKKEYLPWLTYPFIDFISQRLKDDFSLFEFGCGFSTIWFCNRVKKVISIENDPKWSTKISKNLPKNGKIVTYENQVDYINSIDNFDKFDIIVIDGIEREQCYLKALNHLHKNGVIIGDNTDRDDFKKSRFMLEAKGFKEIAFSGLTPSHFVKSQTSILYRSDNCLNI